MEEIIDIKQKIWLSSPHMSGGELDYVHEAFDSNWIAPLGSNVTGFEQELKTYLEKKVEVAALSSGTAALHLALILLGVKSGDEVICQSFTFAASANPIVYQGATPVFIDSESNTWNLCPDALDIAIKDRLANGKKPKAIIAVHLYGMPYNIEKIHNIASQYQITVIEDAAEALGSTYKDQKCGTFGDFSILSFNGNKIITTSGGGALVTKNNTHKEKAVFLATQARDNAPHYQHSEIGYNYRMSNVCAGIGRGQLKALESFVNLRRNNHSFYQKLFSPYPFIQVFNEPDSEYFSNHWLTTIVVNSDNNYGISYKSLQKAFEKENIETRPLWKPLHLQPVFKECPYYGNTTAEDLFNKGLCLPSGSNLNKRDLERITTTVKNLFLLS